MVDQSGRLEPGRPRQSEEDARVSQVVVFGPPEPGVASSSHSLAMAAITNATSRNQKPRTNASMRVT